MALPVAFKDKVDALTVTQDDLAKVIELWTGIPAILW